jgi:thiamine biosynthesis lipoprotein
MFTIQGETMHTYYQVKINHKEIPGNLEQKLKRFISQLGVELSSYAIEGEIYRINKNAGIAGVRVSPKVYFMVKKALEIARESDSAFEPTIGPLVDIWNFKDFKNFPPQKETVEKARELVNWRNVQLEEGRIFLRRKGMKLQLSGIAKGYGIDLIAEFLRKTGIKNFMVEIGGEVYCAGSGPSGEGWRIGIRDPLSRERLAAELDITDLGVATSGNYENYITWFGKKYGHIIDPRTGYPVNNGILSATVIAPTCMEADAWATAVFVLGWEKGKRMILKHPELEGVIIRKASDNDIEIWTSPGIRDKIILYD